MSKTSLPDPHRRLYVFVVILLSVSLISVVVAIGSIIVSRSFPGVTSGINLRLQPITFPVFPSPFPTPTLDSSVVDVRELQKNPGSFTGKIIDIVGTVSEIRETRDGTVVIMNAENVRRPGHATVGIIFDKPLPGVFTGTRIEVVGLGFGEIGGIPAVFAKSVCSEIHCYR